MGKKRRVMLRSERSGADSRFLEAFLDEEGNLHIDGQDLGPGTSPMSEDGEYEWFQTIRQEDVPHLVERLGGTAGAHILDLLETHWSGERSYDLEKILREGNIPVKRHVY
jgi:hypothetical protein